MIKNLGEVLPKTVLFGVVAWGAANWAFLGPELGARTLRANGHIAQCERGYNEFIAQAAEQEMSEIPRPTADPQREAAADAMRQLNSGPLGQFFNAVGSQYGMTFDSTLDAYEEEKRIAKREYKKAIAALKERTTSKLGKGGEYCGCVADVAVSQAQNSFAVYSGTLTLFRRADIRDLDALMLRAAASNACAHLKG